MKKYFLIISIIIFSCQSNDRKNNLIADNTKKLIPYSEDSIAKSSRKEPYLKNLSKLLGLPPIPDSNCNFYLRIWLWKKDLNFVVNINENESRKSCSVLKFRSIIKDSIPYIDTPYQKTNLNPESGWAIFYDTLDKYQIKHLGTGNIQKSQEPMEGMAYVQFEIQQKNNFRYFDYLEPSYYRLVDSNSNNVYRFLMFLNKELKLNVYNPNTNILLDPKLVPKKN